MSHIDDGVLHIYLDGELPSIDPSEAEAVEGHLRSCPGCRNRLEQARQVRTQAHALLGRSGPAVVREPAFEVLVSRTNERPPPAPARPARWRVSAWAASVLLALAVGWYASGRISDGERLSGTTVPMEVAAASDAIPEVEVVPEAAALPEGERATLAPSAAAARDGAVVAAPPRRHAGDAPPGARPGPQRPAQDVAARDLPAMPTTNLPAVERAIRLRSDTLAAAQDMARVEPSPGAADAPRAPAFTAKRDDRSRVARRQREEPATYAAAPTAAPALPAPPAPPPTGDARERPAIVLEELVVTSTIAEAEFAPSSPTALHRWLDETRWRPVDPARAAEHLGGRVRTLPGARVLRTERGEIDGLAAIRTVQSVPGPGAMDVDVEVVQRRGGTAGHGWAEPPGPEGRRSADDGGGALHERGEEGVRRAAVAVSHGEWIVVVRGALAEETLRRLAERMR